MALRFGRLDARMGVGEHAVAMRLEIRPRWKEITDWFFDAWVVGAILVLPGFLSWNGEAFLLGVAIYLALCVVGGSVRRID